MKTSLSLLILTALSTLPAQAQQGRANCQIPAEVGQGIVDGFRADPQGLLELVAQERPEDALSYFDVVGSYLPGAFDELECAYHAAVQSLQGFTPSTASCGRLYVTLARGTGATALEAKPVYTLAVTYATFVELTAAHSCNELAPNEARQLDDKLVVAMKSLLEAI